LHCASSVCPSILCLSASDSRNNKLCRGHGIPPTAVTSVERFHINHVASANRALICLVTLTFDVLTLKLVHIIGVGGQLATNFGFFVLGQHLSDAPLDLATLTFDLGGHGACRYTGLDASSIYQV